MLIPDFITPDVLRLLIIPVFAWAAINDVRERRVPNKLWPPLLVIAFVLLGWDAVIALDYGGRTAFLFAVKAAMTIGIMVPFGFVLWLAGFGGADAKAIMVLAFFFPAYPVFYTETTTLPLHTAPHQIFTLTVLSNALLLTLAFPIALVIRNILTGNVNKWMVIGRPVNTGHLPSLHGWLMTTPNGMKRRGLDLAVLQSYLDWAGMTMADVQTNDIPVSTQEVHDSFHGNSAVGVVNDEWRAEEFLLQADQTYGETPASLREGLQAARSEDDVWVSPGMPFIVPIFAGLVLALSYGDVVTMLFESVGF